MRIPQYQSVAERHKMGEVVDMTAIERVLTNPPSDYTYHWHQIQTPRIPYSKLIAKASMTLRLTKYSSASDTNQNAPTRPPKNYQNWS